MGFGASAVLLYTTAARLRQDRLRELGVGIDAFTLPKTLTIFDWGEPLWAGSGGGGHGRAPRPVFLSDALATRPCDRARAELVPIKASGSRRSM
jgi:hypothetical protein